MFHECVEFIVTTLYKNTLSGRTGGYSDDDLIKFKKKKKGDNLAYHVTANLGHNRTGGDTLCSEYRARKRCQC